MTHDLLTAVATAKSALANLPLEWDGKASILEMKEADFQWKQMEWWGFYFELLCFRRLQKLFEVPGDRIGTVTFDAKLACNWDLKAKAIKSDDHRCILNDKTAMETSIERNGVHGVILGLCDVEYNDINRTFQQWHSELKGGLSKYEKDRIGRTAVSRYRKTKAQLSEILFLRIDKSNLELLETMRQGRNSNGAARPEKYMLNLDKLESFLVDRLVFQQCSEAV